MLSILRCFHNLMQSLSLCNTTRHHAGVARHWSVWTNALASDGRTARCDWWSVPAFALEVLGNQCESSVMMHLLQVGNWTCDLPEYGAGVLRNRGRRSAGRPQFVLVALRLEPFTVSASLVALCSCGRSSPAGRDAHSWVTVFTFCAVTPRSFVDIYVSNFRLSHSRTGSLLC